MCLENNNTSNSAESFKFRRIYLFFFLQQNNNICFIKILKFTSNILIMSKCWNPKLFSSILLLLLPQRYEIYFMCYVKVNTYNIKDISKKISKELPILIYKFTYQLEYKSSSWSVQDKKKIIKSFFCFKFMIGIKWLKIIKLVNLYLLS